MMKKFFREILGIVGFVSVNYGVYQIHEPTVFILSGIFLVYLSLPGINK